MKKKLQNTLIGLCFGLALILSALSFKTPVVPSADKKEQTEQKDKGKQAADKKGAEDQQEQEVLPTPVEEALSLIEPEAYRSVEGITVEPGTFISVLLRDGSSTFADQFKDGINDACDQVNENLGYKGKDKVKITFNAPSTADDISEQSSILDEELGLYPDVVAASIIDESACEVQFDLAMENGIYIVGFDASPGYSESAATVETDNAAAAAESANHLKEAMDLAGGSGPVIFFSSDLTSANMKTRESAAKEALSKQGIQVTNVFHRSDIERARKVVSESLAADDDPENDKLPEEVTEKDIVRFIIGLHPEAKGVWIGDETTAKTVLDVILEDQIDVPAVAFASPGGLDDYMEQNALYGAIEENPYGMGYATAAAALRIVSGEGNSDKIETGYRWHPADD